MALILQIHSCLLHVPSKNVLSKEKSISREQKAIIILFVSFTIQTCLFNRSIKYFTYIQFTMHCAFQTYSTYGFLFSLLRTLSSSVSNLVDFRQPVNFDYIFKKLTIFPTSISEFYLLTQIKLNHCQELSMGETSLSKFDNNLLRDTEIHDF